MHIAFYDQNTSTWNRSRTVPGEPVETILREVEKMNAAGQSLLPVIHSGDKNSTIALLNQKVGDGYKYTIMIASREPYTDEEVEALRKVNKC